MTVRLSRSKKILLGLGIAVVMLGILELSLRGYSAFSGRNLTVAPVLMATPEEVLFDRGDELELLPQRHGVGPEPGAVGQEPGRAVIFSKTPTRPRVVVIGESFVYCTRLKAHESWPARLEALLDGAVEVLNFGRVGSYASMLVPVVEASLGIDADVIVLAIGNNEHTMTTYYMGWAGRHPNLVYSLSEALGNVHIYGLLYHLFLGVQRVMEAPDGEEGRSRELENPIDREIYAIRRRPPELSVIADRLARPAATAALEAEQRLKEKVFRNILEVMVEDIQAAGVKVILATLPIDLARRPIISGMHVGGISDEDEARHRAVMKNLLAGSEFSDIQDLALEQGLTDEDFRFNSHYQHVKGIALLNDGETDEALVALRRAIEWDMVPDNTPSLNEIIRAVAREYDCPLIDLNKKAETYVDRRSAFFLDDIHVNAEGAEVVAGWVAEVLQEEMGLGGGD